MPQLLFTARTAHSLKPTTARVEYFDRKVAGLALRVAPSGVKTWTVLYRHRGRLRRLTLGTADAIVLADARERARDAIRDASKGIDVALAKQTARTAETIADLADLYVEKWAKPRKRSWKADDRILRAEILPTWKHRAIVDIRRKDVKALVDAIAARGAGILANRVVALCSKLFRFAVDEELIDASPAVNIPRPAVEQSRDRVFSDDELRKLWKAFGKLEAPMGAYFKLRLLTAQRGQEVASMQWADLDLKNAWWTVPAGVTKNKLQHRVPLSPSVVAILKALPKPDDVPYVLAGARGKRQQAEASARFPVKDFHGHDLRRTAATLMTGGGVPRLIVSKILNHAENGITAVYDRSSYDADKRVALEWWDRKLKAILANKPTTVLAFQRSA